MKIKLPTRSIQVKDVNDPGASTRRAFIKGIGLGATAVASGGALLSQAACSGPAKIAEKESMPNRTQMKNALKVRIKVDDPANFTDGKWDKTRLGVFYDEDDELVDIVIYETTAGVASTEGRFLPDQVWQSLIAKIGPSNTPEEAIDPMMDAALRSEPLPVGDEGPVIHRPRQRPTLRSARKNVNG